MTATVAGSPFRDSCRSTKVTGSLTPNRSQRSRSARYLHWRPRSHDGGRSAAIGIRSTICLPGLRASPESTAVSFSPNLNVWTLGKGARGQWKLHHTTDSMQDAASWFAKLEKQGKQVVLYELGLFQHEGHQIAGQVAFWWSANLNEAMEREPEDRGVGWADGYDTWVEYTYPEQVESVRLPNCDRKEQQSHSNLNTAETS